MRNQSSDSAVTPETVGGDEGEEGGPIWLQLFAVAAQPQEQQSDLRLVTLSLSGSICVWRLLGMQECALERRFSAVRNWLVY